MKQLLKKLFSGTAVVALALLMAGCYSDHARYAQTHQKDNVSSAHAEIYQTYGAKERLGKIVMKETEAGMDLETDLKWLHPGVTYRLFVRDVNGARRDVHLPSIVGPENRQVDNTYIAHGVSAQQLVGHVVELEREGKIVGHGKIISGFYPVTGSLFR